MMKIKFIFLTAICACSPLHAEKINELCRKHILTDERLIEFRDKLISTNVAIDASQKNSANASDWKLAWSIYNDNQNAIIELDNIRIIMGMNNSATTKKIDSITNIFIDSSINSLVQELISAEKTVRLYVPLINDSRLANISVSHRSTLRDINSKMEACKQ